MTEVPRLRVLCREGEEYGVVCDRAGEVGGERLLEGEHRLPHHALVRWVVIGTEVVSGPLDLPVNAYLSTVEAGTLHRALFELPVVRADRAPLVLVARGRYQVTAVRRTAGKRGPIDALELVERGRPENVGLTPIAIVMARLVTPPGANLAVIDGEHVYPVVLRLTTHAENQHENDLIALPGCKGKWGRLEELG